MMLISAVNTSKADGTDEVMAVMTLWQDNLPQRHGTIFNSSKLIGTIQIVTVNVYAPYLYSDILLVLHNIRMDGNRQL